MSNVPRRFRLRAIAFDLDGTLVDSFADLATAVNTTRAAYGQPPLSLAEVKSHVGNGTEQLVARTVPGPPDGLPVAHRRFVAEYDRCLLETTRPYPGVEDTLARLGGLPLGLITNKTQRHTEALLAGLGWRERFRIVLGGDALSAKKPDPLPLLHFAKQIGCSPSDVAMVGDGVVDVRAGRAAGMATVAVSYGNTSAEILAAERPDAVIPRLPDLLDLIIL